MQYKYVSALQNLLSTAATATYKLNKHVYRAIAILLLLHIRTYILFKNKIFIKVFSSKLIMNLRATF